MGFSFIWGCLGKIIPDNSDCFRHFGRGDCSRHLGVRNQDPKFPLLPTLLSAHAWHYLVQLSASHRVAQWTVRMKRDVTVCGEMCISGLLDWAVVRQDASLGVQSGNGLPCTRQTRLGLRNIHGVCDVIDPLNPHPARHSVTEVITSL